MIPCLAAASSCPFGPKTSGFIFPRFRSTRLRNIVETHPDPPMCHRSVPNTSRTTHPRFGKCRVRGQRSLFLYVSPHSPWCAEGYSPPLLASKYLRRRNRHHVSSTPGIHVRSLPFTPFCRREQRHVPSTRIALRHGAFLIRSQSTPPLLLTLEENLRFLHARGCKQCHHTRTRRVSERLNRPHRRSRFCGSRFHTDTLSSFWTSSPRHLLFNRSAPL